MGRRVGLPLSALVAGLVGGFAAPKLSAVYAPAAGGVTGARAVETAQQQPPQEKAPPTVDAATAAKNRRVEQLTTGLKGAWRLTRMQPAAPVPAPRQVSGLLFVSDHILTITFHALPDASTLVQGTRIQGGAHYWRIGPRETLETAALLGHDNFQATLSLEPQLEPREYVVDLTARNLVLSKRDGTRLEFERMDVQSFPPQAIRFIDAMREGRDLDDLRGR
jgi:hypothetical protein